MPMPDSRASPNFLSIHLPQVACRFSITGFAESSVEGASGRLTADALCNNADEFSLPAVPLRKFARKPRGSFFEAITSFFNLGV
nr:uncharacterized protein LOC109161635 isoform X1 [Ipomoea batatas]GMD76276.1 uncharacterized protein LOC109161635 isoform X1 [Ipomoea batatas]